MTLFARTASFALAAAAAATAAVAGPKPSVVLVHGAWEQSDVWGHVTPALENDGYKVIVVTMPGRPQSPAAPDKVSLDLYRDTILQAIAGENRPVVLVGHSFAGIPISAAAEKAPRKIKTLVYLAAYLPKDGQTLLDLGNSDKDSKVGPALQIEKERGIIAIAYNARADLFASDGPDALRQVVPGLIVDEPLAPLVSPIHLTAGRFGSVDKVYIHTAKDKVVSPWLQARMVAATPVRRELTLQTGHTPFLNAPDDVVKAIETAAK